MGRIVSSKLTLFLILVVASSISASEDMTSICSNGSISSIDSQYRCACAKLQAEDRDAILNYLTFHYCTMASVSWLSLTLLITYLLFLFYIIAGTADNYLVPALTVGVDMLQISPNVAGATILAFANGAPDLFTSIAAFSGDGGDGNLGIGAVLGGGMFIVAFTLGIVVLSSGGLEIYRRPLIRDLSAYLIGIALFFYIFQDGKAYVSEAVAFLCLYVCYVLTVVIGRYVYQRYIKPRQHENKYKCPLQLQVKDVAVSPPAEGSLVTLTPKVSEPSRSLTGSVKEFLHEEMRHSLGNCLLKSPSQTSCAGSPSVQSSICSLFQELTQWDEKTALGRILATIELPVTLARRLTIALVEPDTWNQYFAVLSLFFAPLFVLFVVTTPSLGLAIGVSIFGIVLSVAGWFLTSDKAPTQKPVLLFFVCIAFVLSSFWAYIIANEIVDVMQTIGLGVGISSGVLGVTVLAWGNSIGDFISNLALAKNGHGRMAAAECYGGPIFNLMFAIGISLLLGCLKVYPQPFVLHTSDVVAGYGFICLSAMVLLTAIIVPLQGFKLTKLFAVVMLVGYAVFLLLAVLSEIGVLPPLMRYNNSE